MLAKSTPPLLRELVHRLKALREGRKLTLLEVYDATGIHIGRVESRHLNITVTTLAVLCQHYQVTLSEVLHNIEQEAD
jgi:transcriptional regulator with XRE-family HTH domain